MRIIRFYSLAAPKGTYPRTNIKLFRKGQLEPEDITICKLNAKPSASSVSTIHEAEPKTSNSLQSQLVESHAEPKKETDPISNEYVENFVNIQMISQNIHKQLFPNTDRKTIDKNEPKAKEFLNDLKRHGIDINKKDKIKDILLKFPDLKGGNIEDHFLEIAKEQIKPYRAALLDIIKKETLPKKPKKWSFKEGWTKYDSKTQKPTRILWPTEEGLVFDVEVCVAEGNLPTLATAVSANHWYSWVSPYLLQPPPCRINQKQNESCTNYTLKDLIPMGEDGKVKLIIGHNVSYDRARISEQYLLEDTLVRFLDTMSLHTCISGITSYQRAMLKSKKEPDSGDLEWMSECSLNSLSEVYKLYCQGTINKDPRNIFVEGSLADVKNNFQMLMSYCAADVAATWEILKKIFPMYEERFPHPVTLAGMLEMNSAYLPINSNWKRYINESDLAYEDKSIEAKYHLARRADEACRLLKDEKYRSNIWLWNEDWSTQALKLKQTKTKRKNDSTRVVFKAAKENEKEVEGDEEAKQLEEQFKYLYDTKEFLPVRRPLLPGYPAWYRKLCEKPPKDLDLKTSWIPGAQDISTGMQIAPKLLSLCWEGYPLHYEREHGWGFLVPFRLDRPTTSNENTNGKPQLPIKELINKCPIPEFARKNASQMESEYAMGSLIGDLEMNLSKKQFISKPKKDKTDGQYTGSGIWCNHIIDGCCFFMKLPHKNGPSNRVGNPLSKDFLNKFSENVLSSADSEASTATEVIENARTMSYWRNNRDRIIGQLVVWLPFHKLPKELKIENELFEFGAILPQVVVCGTLTRRAMEPTWMTASNTKSDRIGSELRAMVQAPPSYKIVGADVDSQELWIASVLGDAYACGEHGGTPLGWMTLSGAKSNGTDMHSVTAKAVGISRDHAKVINYARIYGAGQNFAEGLLKQFNPTFSSSEAKSKASKMFGITKGKRKFRLLKEYVHTFEDQEYTYQEAYKLSMATGIPLKKLFHHPQWTGGTESAMFNRLEEIATSQHPVTPFLNCRLSRALESSSSDTNRFLPTRVNWVVQSGAVDFLHLMLVSMRWLMGPHVRFCLSFHDELRYLAKEEMAYKAALAMHITNLLTRAFCSSRIGLKDLPMSVAFFSSVEVDRVLRKEATMDCKTPSNPHGLKIGYGIPTGESLNIYTAIEKAEGGDLTKWDWIK